MSYNVAIIGSGPSGFFAAEALLAAEMGVRVDMFERLPVPFGLVRFGVAPDHQKLKSVISVFEEIAKDPNFSFFGNVEIGRDIDVAQLRATYDAVIVATGANSGRKLGIVGEDLVGSFSAPEFVGWYNGHPDFQDLEVDLSNPTAVIIGNGNVALDVCRILAKSVEELSESDICDHALQVLAKSKVKDIYLVGRRGPVQAKFTLKELREFGQLDVAQPIVIPDELELNDASTEELGAPANFVRKKNLSILNDFDVEGSESSKPKRVHFRFNLSPKKIAGTERVEEVLFEETRLSGPAFVQKAEPTGKEVSIPAGLVVSSVGYRGSKIPGVPFDQSSATIPHLDGRVRDESDEIVPGLYVVGWIKRGPSGVIGTNRACSVDTVSAVLDDLRAETRKDEELGRRDALIKSLSELPTDYVDFSRWERIDTLEREEGARRGKPREKFTRVQSMLDVSQDAEASSFSTSRTA
ncbi:FAD-dependent oxidoreductase [Cognatishimia maritima]|uniref:Ferredoxin--NADP+ reductase n=1 Tax=Cognatishimia maritima TaxID=870908 RepID=A0A1M5QAK9_9RHOB|nr:FAD-dependent oxidoreductase [Cognatishimia maritima]SHH10851.1 ferredoxin--NADP+ reductase [Cognatishimia maritima]